jgi:MFS family permease
MVQENEDQQSTKTTIADEKSLIVKSSGKQSKTQVHESKTKTIESEEECSSKAQEIEKGEKQFIFWPISVFTATAQNFYNSFFTNFAASVGAKGSLIGFLTSIQNLLKSLFQGTIGRLSDIFGRRIILMIGFILGFGSCIPLIFWEHPGLLIVVAIVQSVSFSIVVPTWNAVLGDTTDKEKRASYMGKIISVGRALSVFATLSVSIFFYLVDTIFHNWVIWGRTVDLPWRMQYSVVFGIAAANFLFCLICTFILKETRKTNHKEAEPTPRIFKALKDKKFLRFLIVYSAFGLTMSMVWPLNPIVQIKVLDMSLAEIAIISAVFIFVLSLSQIFGGKLGDRLGRKPVMIGSVIILIFYPASLIPAVIVNKWWVLILSRVVGGLGFGSFFVTINAYSLDLAPETMYGSYNGLKEVFYGITTFIGSLLSGFIFDILEPRMGIYSATILLGGLISGIRLLASFGFFFVYESFEPNNKRNNNKKNNIVEEN